MAKLPTGTLVYKEIPIFTTKPSRYPNNDLNALKQSVAPSYQPSSCN